jgi:hypothetical protein
MQIKAISMPVEARRSRFGSARFFLGIGRRS